MNYIVGNLLDTPDKYIIHGCNSQGVMGSGVALQIKETYPQAYTDYRELCQLLDPIDLLGRTKVSLQPDGKVIINAITQLNYGKDGRRYVSYDAIDDCMRGINDWLPKNEICSISIPRIGAGLGGGNWKVIEQIISERLWFHEVTVWDLYY